MTGVPCELFAVDGAGAVPGRYSRPDGSMPYRLAEGPEMAATDDGLVVAWFGVPVASGITEVALFLHFFFSWDGEDRRSVYKAYDNMVVAPCPTTLVVRTASVDRSIHVASGGGGRSRNRRSLVGAIRVLSRR